MENTALVRLFEILNAAEKKRIKKKLENTERKGIDMLLLFNYLDKHIKRPEKIKKKEVFKGVYGKLKKFNESKLTQLRFKLYRFIEDQIVIDQILGTNENKEHQIQKELILLEYFRDKVVPKSQRSVEGIARLVESKMGDLAKLIESTKVRGIYYHLNFFRLSHFLYYNLNAEIRGEGKPYLDQLMNNLDIFYCLSKLSYSLEMMQRQKVVNEKEVPILLFDEVYRYSEMLDTKNYPLVEIYRLQASLSKRLNKDKIILLKNKVFKYADQLGREELPNSINLLLNFIMQISNEKGIDMIEHKYEIYTFFFQEKLCIMNGEIRPIFLINFAIACNQIGKSDKIFSIVDAFKGYISRDYKDKTIKLCNAYFLFGSTNFKNSFEEIHDKSFHPFNLQAKVLKLKTLFEIEHSLNSEVSVSLYDAIKNFERFIRRQKNNKKISEHLYNSLLNFSRFLDLFNQGKSKEELTELLVNYSPIVERSWLLDKIKMSNLI